MCDEDAAQPIILISMWIQAGVGSYGLPKTFKTLEIMLKILSGLWIA
jgi:hypothetical protein